MKYIILIIFIILIACSPAPDDSINIAVISLHGGGWRRSDGCFDNIQFMNKLTEYDVIIPDFTLSNDPNFVDPFTTIMDIKSVVDSAKLTHDEVFLCGRSSGGHLALFYSILRPYDIKGVIDIAGPSDLTTLADSAWDEDTIEILRGMVADFSIIDGRDLRKSFSINVDSGVPSLLIYNTLDSTVDYDTQAIPLFGTFPNADIRIFNDPTGHIFVDRHEDEIINSIRDFIKKNE